MTKTGWAVVLGSILLIGAIVAAIFLFRSMTPAVTTTEQSPVAAPETEATPSSGITVTADIVTAANKVVTVTYTEQGFSPQSVSVDVGDTVHFVNSSSHGMWVGVDEHPTHTKYDGTSTKEHCAQGKTTNGTFDTCTPLPAGTSYDFKFTKLGTFPYHNHVRAASVGTVIVK